MWRGVDQGMREGWAHEQEMKTTADGNTVHKTEFGEENYSKLMKFYEENSEFFENGGWINMSSDGSVSMRGGYGYNGGNKSNNIG
jgi:hypothetical protein